MPEKVRLFWLFFRLSGRLSPAACFLAGLLLIIIQFFLLYRFMQAPLDTLESEMWALAFWIAVVVSAWSNFALTAKRFHDFGKPTAYALLSLVAGFILFIILAVIKGNPGPNQYGQRTNAPAQET